MNSIMGIIQFTGCFWVNFTMTSHDLRPTGSFTSKTPPIDGTFHEILEIGELITRRKVQNSNPQKLFFV